MAEIQLTSINQDVAADSTAMPSVVVIQWSTGSFTYSAAIRPERFYGTTPSSKTDDAVWQVARLETSTGSLTYPVVGGVCDASFGHQVHTAASGTLAQIKAHVEALTFWEAV